MAVFGKISDVYGRRSVFYWTTTFTVLIFLTFTLDAWVGPLPDWVIYATAPFQCSAFVHDIVGWSMTVDLVPDPVDQAKLFPLLVPILGGTVASAIGDILAFFVLQLHLTDYTIVWLVLTLIAVAACIFILTLLPETLTKRKPFPGIKDYIKDVMPPIPSCGREDATAAYLLLNGRFYATFSPKTGVIWVKLAENERPFNVKLAVGSTWKMIRVVMVSSCSVQLRRSSCERMRWPPGRSGESCWCCCR